MTAKLLCGDVRALLKTLPDQSVRCCVTSPPYWGLRDYGEPGQIGLEQTPDAYVAELVAVFREVKRVLTDDGTLWLNLGDSYAAARGGTTPPAQTVAGGVNGQGGVDERRGMREGYNPSRNASAFGLKHKDLVGIPWMVAFALRQDGWYLRRDIIWAKPNPMPESVRDRPTSSHEYLFLFSKGQRVSRVVEVADLCGELVHFGKHVGSEKPAFREPVSNFCVTLASALFDGAQRQNNFSLPPFYAEEWHQGPEGVHRDPICDHPHVGRLAAIAARLLAANTTTKEFLEQMHRFWLDLGAGDTFLVGGIESLAGTPSVYVDADGAVAVNDSGEVRKFDFSHNRIIVERPSTCNYYYDAGAIAEEAIHAGRVAGLHDPSSAKNATSQGNSNGTAAGFTKHDTEVGATRNARSVWTIATQPYAGAHFATFPGELPTRCIKAGTSEKGGCAKCGAPMVRITEKKREYDHTTTQPGKSKDGPYAAQTGEGAGTHDIRHGVRSRTTTTGWKASCECGEGFVPDTVLDPFGGSGTTAAMAVGLGRKAIHIDLNPKYIELAKQRIGPMLCE